MTHYIDVSKTDINSLSLSDTILLVTATHVETVALHSKVHPLPTYQSILKAHIGNLTYFFGQFGVYKICHVQCSMGSSSRDSSIMTLTEALSFTKCKVVIMVGIAFGSDQNTQQIGDVLVSESIIPYDSKRVGQNETVQRGIEAPSSKILLNRFRNMKTTWQYILPTGKQSNLTLTRILSGEELVDNSDRRNDLLASNPDSKGGEMEGAGVFAACDGKADWIIIKGICDFADGDKSKMKQERQEIAISAAISLCQETFNSPSVFEELGVSPQVDHKKSEFVRPPNLNAVLFDVYRLEVETFYIKRRIDEIFLSQLNQFGVWIYGPPGCGKSNLILRNLIFNKKRFIQISLACCIGQDVEYFFLEILSELQSYSQSDTQVERPKSFTDCSKAILAVLKEKYSDGEFIIFIEEIPITSEQLFRSFSEKLFSLLISKTFVGELAGIRFILSSIGNPALGIQVVHQKIHQQTKFLAMELWPTEETDKIVALIEMQLNFKLDPAIRNQLIEKSNGSPRFIKKFFRSIYVLNKNDERTLELLINETKRELN